MAVLSGRLRYIGDTLAAGGEPARAAPVVRRSRMRRGPLALAASVVVLVCALGVGVLWRAAQPAGEGGDAKLTESGMVACARTIADGSVTRTEEAGGSVRVVLAVERYLKPERGGPAEMEFLVSRDEAGYFRPGERMVVSISRFAGEGVQSYTGADREAAWEWMSAVLPESRSLGCPGPG
ncbi:hypothetical protein [Streptomyces sp. NPDC005969]|uniref:hypothetical protein n=1 Tax=Streptomyces sp. NPDC005969 TaxID=3156722 RepID=UPI0033DE5597